MTRARARSLPVAVVLFAVGLAPSAFAETGEAETFWYSISLGEAPVGWMSESVFEGPHRRIEETRIEMSFARGDLRQTITMASRFEADAGGRPLRAETSQTMGETRIDEEWTFRERDVVVRTVAGGEERVRHHLRPEDGWPSPWAEDRGLAAALAAGSESFEVTVFDPQVGPTPVVATWKRLAHDDIVSSPEGDVATTRWLQTYDFAPELPTTTWVDAEGRLVRSRTSMLGLDLEIRRSTAETVRDTEARPPELLLRTFVVPDRAIDRPREVNRGVYELSALNGTLTGIPESGRQTAVQDGRLVRVVVDTTEPPAAAGDVDLARHLLATAHLDHDTAPIQELLESAQPLPEVPAERARELRRLVARHLESYDLRSLLATASEVAEARTGDCTEHSVLLAALLRATGIPSRVVFGLIYVDEFLGEERIFGYHMWTQALIDGAWLDLDALMGPDDEFDATHLALASTDLSDPGSMTVELARLAPLFGRLEVRVVEIGHRAPGL